MRSFVGAFCPRCLPELFDPFFPARRECAPLVVFFFGVLVCAASADTPSPATKDSSRTGRTTFRLIIVIVSSVSSVSSFFVPEFQSLSSRVFVSRITERFPPVPLRVRKLSGCGYY